VNIRSADPQDLEAILEVERRAFGSTEEADIVAAVCEEPSSFGLVAEEDGAVIGHVQFSAATIGDTEVLALGPIGVLPPSQGRGIGRALIEAGIAESRARGAIAVIILGSPKRYARFGFQPASRWGLRNPFAGTAGNGFTISEEEFQVFALDEAARLRGQVRWHPAFG
jgi:putative acetyltransferase